MTEPTEDRSGRILDAALSEFAEHGYVAASTSGIATRANVAKALVFHHYSSKEALFLAVYAMVSTRIEAAMDECLRDAPPDLLARVLLWTERKLGMFREDPRMLRLYLVVLPQAPKEIRLQVSKQRTESMMDLSQRFLAGIDASVLSVSAELAFDALSTLSAGIEQRILALPPKQRTQAHLEALTDRARTMFTLLARGLYHTKERATK
ncbi:MAG: helix-turn-helix domain-containing protein [Deltaproteobacteria bacterium]|nr:helix-turn-helix domain-containing protein [Deltaproteobacteria bacterium]